MSTQSRTRSASAASTPPRPSGSEAARGGLGETEIRALAPRLLVFARRAIGDAATAEDLVQEALVAAIQNMESFDRRSELRTWVTGILSHKVVDHFRRAQVRRWESEDAIDEAALVSGGARNPEAQLSDRQALGVLERALQTLAARERMAVMMCDVEGLERDEVCNALGVSATNLRVLLHRARHRLRKALEDAGV